MLEKKKKSRGGAGEKGANYSRTRADFKIVGIVVVVMVSKNCRLDFKLSFSCCKYQCSLLHVFLCFVNMSDFHDFILITLRFPEPSFPAQNFGHEIDSLTLGSSAKI